MINSDKILHFFTGFFIATCFGFLGILWMFFVGILMGILKEVYDKIKGGKFDWIDFACTGTGAFIAVWIKLIEY